MYTLTSTGYYYTSSAASTYTLGCSANYYGCDEGPVYDGCPIRPVRASHKPKAIDLGLPSGTKWANCNVGASKPEEYGDYYAWGETGTKLKYNDGTYLFNEEDEDWGYVPISLGEDISGTKYDVARMKWGGKWHMPTEYDIEELFEYCTNEWTTLNGVNGRKFTSKKNGNSIFLPAAGCHDYYGLKEVGECGYYSSSMLYPPRVLSTIFPVASTLVQVLPIMTVIDMIALTVKASALLSVNKLSFSPA